MKKRNGGEKEVFYPAVSMFNSCFLKEHTFLRTFWLLCYRKVPNAGLLLNDRFKSLCARDQTLKLDLQTFQDKNISAFSFPKNLHSKMCLSATLDVCSFFTISLQAKVLPFNFDGMDSNSASTERLQ